MSGFLIVFFFLGYPKILLKYPEKSIMKRIRAPARKRTYID